VIIRPLMITAFAASLSYCASETVPVNYYLLTSNSAQGVTQQTLGNKPAVVLDSVEVANYLRQSGIVMQTADTQVQISKRHLWAETLDVALPKFLFQELQKQSDDFNFYLKNSDFIPRTDYRLLVHIDSFQANDNGEVICSGRYQIISQTNDELAVTVDFNFKRALENDGYDHAIEQLRSLVGEIASNALRSTLALNNI